MDTYSKHVIYDTYNTYTCGSFPTRERQWHRRRIQHPPQNPRNLLHQQCLHLFGLVWLVWVGWIWNTNTWGVINELKGVLFISTVVLNSLGVYDTRVVLCSPRGEVSGATNAIRFCAKCWNNGPHFWHTFSSVQVKPLRYNSVGNFSSEDEDDDDEGR